MPTPEHDEDPKTAAEKAVKARLLAAKEQLLAFRRKQTEYFLKAASEVLALKADLPKDEVKTLVTWLHADVGFSLAESKSYLGFDQDLKEMEHSFIVARTSPDTMRQLVRSTRKTRSDAYILVRRNDYIDAPKVRSIRKVNAVATTSMETAGRRLRNEMFSRAARRLGDDKKQSLERDASDLLELMGQEFGMENSRESYNVSDARPTPEAVSQKAAAVRRSLEELFPDFQDQSPDLRRFEEKGVAAASIARAWQTLRRLQRDIYGHKCTYGDPYNNIESRMTIEFLAGIRQVGIHGIRLASTARPQAKSGLTFVDIDAGVGTTALGLNAAGFEPLGVFGRDVNGIAAIRSNMPHWRPQDVSEIVHQVEFLQSKDVDVVTSGMPWHHRKKHDQHGSGRKAIKQDAIDAVKKIRPKTFFFEVLRKDSMDAQFFEDFRKSDYEVRCHKIDVGSFGIPQERARYIMVGVRKGVGSIPSIPLIDPPVKMSIWKAMGDLINRYVAAASTSEENREAFVKKWKGRWQTGYAPSFPNFAEPRDLKGWSSLGIDIDDRPISASADALAGGLKLTNEMLLRLQGFPIGWRVRGPSSSNSRLVAASLPPVVAKMIGLAIHSALNGTEFDHRRALRYGLLGKEGYVPVHGRVVLPPNVWAFISDPGQALVDHGIGRRLLDMNRPLKRIASWHPHAAVS